MHDRVSLLFSKSSFLIPCSTLLFLNQCLIYSQHFVWRGYRSFQDTIVYGELLALQLFLMIPLSVYPAVPEMSEFLECLCELISISATEQ